MIHNFQKAILYLLLLPLVLSGACASTEQVSENSDFPNDYSITNIFEQPLDLDGIQTINIQCYCDSGFIRENVSNKKSYLRVIVTQDSQGYHGDQKIPDGISQALLSFKVTRNGSTLNLESREYIYIHHAYLVDELQVFVPTTMQVKLDKLQEHQLQGRNIN